jgi:hypothetical protein
VPSQTPSWLGASRARAGARDGGRRGWRELWGTRDFEDERRELAALSAPLPIAPPRTPGYLKFTLHEPPIFGVRSQASDEAIARHIGRRYRRRS